MRIIFEENQKKRVENRLIRHFRFADLVGIFTSAQNGYMCFSVFSKNFSSNRITCPEFPFTAFSIFL